MFGIPQGEILNRKKSVLQRKFIEKSYLQIDYSSKVTILQDQLNKVRNSVNMKEFTANVSAIDPTARLEKQNRKNEKLKLLYVGISRAKVSCFLNN